MACALVVERDTNELRIVLQRGCQPVAAESVKLTITRAGLTCRETLLPCDDSCGLPRPVMDCPTSKVYPASRIELGLVVFLLDQDITEAPEGWYQAMIDVDGCDVAILPLLVRRSSVTVSSCRVTCTRLSTAN